MSTQHTPGPWRFWTCRVDSSLQPPMYDYAQFANPKGHVFRAPLQYLSEADARLIAASPELLETLKRLRLMCADFGATTACDIAAAAIFKATGEQE